MKLPTAMSTPPHEDGVALPDQAVGDPAAGDGEQVGAAREQPVHRAGGRAVDAEARVRAEHGAARNSTSIARMP